MTDKPPSCMGCVHHYITHDRVFRYGCHAFGFKSQQIPARVVQQASGEPCKIFEIKKKQ